MKWNPTGNQFFSHQYPDQLFITFINNFTDERDYTLSKFENSTTLGYPERESCYSEELSNAEKWTDGSPVPGCGAALLQKLWGPSGWQRRMCYLGTLQLTVTWTVLTQVQAGSLGKWLFTSHQYLWYHIWTEHVVLDSQVPERCGCVEVQQNTAEVRDTRRCDRWDKTEKWVCPGQRKGGIEEIVLWSASPSWECSKKTDLGCSQDIISGRTRGNRQNTDCESEL